MMNLIPKVMNSTANSFAKVTNSNSIAKTTMVCQCRDFLTELCCSKYHYYFLAKSRVAPSTQSLTLPKLGLMGALTVARLCGFVSQALATLHLSIQLWSESQNVLHWIKGQKLNNIFVTHWVTHNP